MKRSEELQIAYADGHKAQPGAANPYPVGSTERAVWDDARKHAAAPRDDPPVAGGQGRTMEDVRDYACIAAFALFMGLCLAVFNRLLPGMMPW